MTAQDTITAEPRRVLIVEDELNQRRMLTRAVQEAEFTSAAVGSAEDALALLEKDERFSIAMLDLNLPNMDGLTLAARIHDRWPRMRAIILTGYASLEAAQQAIKLDVVDFLTKPASLGEIESALSRAWGKFCDNAPLPQLAPNSEPPRPTPVDPQSLIRIADAEREMIIAALRRHHDNRTAAARELGISVRTLYYRLARYEAEDKLRGTRKTADHNKL